MRYLSLVLLMIGILETRCTINEPFEKLINFSKDKAGNFYIVKQNDDNTSKILKLDKNLNYISSIDNLSHVPFINVGKDQMLYVTNEILDDLSGAFVEEQIIQYDLDGNFVRYILKYVYTTEETKDSNFHHVFWNHYTDKDGNVYVTNFTPNYCIWKIDKEYPYYFDKGKLISEDRVQRFVKNDIGRKNLAQVIVSENNNDIFIVNCDTNKIERYNKDGDFICTIGEEGFDKDNLMSPWFMAFNKSNHLVVVDYGNKRLQVFSINGEYIFTIPVQNGTQNIVMNNIIIDDDNSYNIIDNKNNQLLFFSEDGKLIKILSTYYRLSYTPLWLIIIFMMSSLTFIFYYKNIKKYLSSKSFRIPLLSKLIFLIIPVILMSSIGIGIFMYNSIQSEKRDELNNNLLSIANAIAITLDKEKFISIQKSSNIHSDEYKEIYDKASEIVHGVSKKLNESYSFIICKIQNNILYYGVDTFRQGIFLPLTTYQKDFEIINRCINQEIVESLPITSQIRNYFSAVVPVIYNKNLISIVIVQKDIQLFEVQRNKAVVKLTIYSLGIVFFCIVLLFVFSITFTKPIRMLRNSLLQVAESEFNELKGIKSNDEVGDLVKGYNVMIYKIQEFIKSIKQKDEIIQIHYKEKIHIAREVHDKIGNWISTIRLRLSDIIESEIDLEKKESLESILSLAENELWESRNISAVLKNSDNLLEKFIDSLKIRYEKLYNKCKTKVLFLHSTIPDMIISPKLQMNILSIYQEILVNIRKHSNATSVSISFQFIDNCIEIKITDNGIGFDIQNVVHSGLNNIIERVRELNGECEIISSVNQGTTVNVSIPLTFEED